MTVQAILNGKGDRVETVAATLPVNEAVALLTGKRIGALVVCGADRQVLGIISERDIIRGLASRGAAILKAPVADLMTRSVSTGRLDHSVAAVLTIMTEQRIRHLPILSDGDDRLCGMVSIGDAVKARLDEVETEAHAMRDYIAGG